MSFVSIAYPISFTVGVLLFQPIRESFKKYLGAILIIMMILNNTAAIGLCSLSNSLSDVPLYYILITLTSFLYSGVNIYTATTDLKNRTSSSHQYMIVNSANRFLFRIVQALIFLFSGILMDKDVMNLMRIFTIIAYL